MPSEPTTKAEPTQPSEDNQPPQHDDIRIISSFANGSNPWEQGIKLSKKFDDDMCEMLKDELENLLLFAALFSAIVTSFTVVSYQWLQPNNTNNPSPVPYNLAVQINFLWFMSLAASLSVSSIGILCMQWVRQYRRWKAKTDRRTAALRRQRYEGFLHWHVPNIVAALPVILQIALVLFGVGVNNLLWSLHHVVAVGFAAVSIPALVFIVGTTLAPLFQWSLRQKLPGKWWKSQCPYQSPQAWLSYLIICILFWIPQDKCDPNWEEFDRSWLLKAASVGDNKGTPSQDDSNHHHASPNEFQLLRDELIWLDREYADDTDAIKARAQALRQLRYEDAKKVVTTLFRTLKVPSATRHRETVSRLHPLLDVLEEERNFKELKVWYLWGHAQIHPSLDDAYMEARIDFMSEIPTRKIDLPGPPRASHLDIQCLTKDQFLVPRFLHCLKVLIRLRRLKKETSAEMWRIIGDLLEYSIRHARTGYFAALSSLLDTLCRELKEFDQYRPQDGGTLAIAELDQASTSSYPLHATQAVTHTQPEPDWKAWEVSSTDTVNDMLNGLHFFFALHTDQKIGRLEEKDVNFMKPLRDLVTFLDGKVALTGGTPPAPQGGPPVHASPHLTVHTVEQRPEPPDIPRSTEGTSQAQAVGRPWNRVQLKVVQQAETRRILQGTGNEVLHSQRDKHWETLVEVITKWTTLKGEGDEKHLTSSGSG